MISTMTIAQTDSTAVTNNFFGFGEQVLKQFGSKGADDPVRISRAKKVNSSATKKSLKVHKILDENYEKGEIDFFTYATLKARESQISVEEWIEEYSLIRRSMFLLKIDEPDND